MTHPPSRCAPESEAWFVAGFEPEDDGEHARLAAVRQRVGRDPCMASHELTSGLAASPRDAKRALAELTDGSDDRAARCLDDLERLRLRGADNGCAAFIREVGDRVAPLVRGYRP